jgi:hypothetical protein
MTRCLGNLSTGSSANLVPREKPDPLPNENPLREAERPLYEQSSRGSLGVPWQQERSVVCHETPKLRANWNISHGAYPLRCLLLRKLAAGTGYPLPPPDTEALTSPGKWIYIGSCITPSSVKWEVFRKTINGAP